MKKPGHHKLVEKWKQANSIYATPTGSNDDWYDFG
jgi:proteinaceous RNase P